MSEAIIFLIIGVVLIIAELALFSFYLIFFGIGFLIIGIFSFFVFFGWNWQILTAFVIGLVLLILFRKKIVNRFFKKSLVKDDFLNESGFGIIKNGMVFYKGTFWKCDIKDLKDGQSVEILGIKDGKIVIKG